MTLDAASRIGVLCGGPSAEAEISLRSGAAVCEALLSLNLPAILLKLSKRQEEIPEQIKRAGIGTAFVALHGTFGEDGVVQALLEEMGIAYTGSPPKACHLAMNKISSRRRWLAAGLPIPKWAAATVINAQARAQELSFPLMVKPVAQGSSLGVVLVESQEELPAACAEASQFGEDLILEEYLPGAEITVGILEERALPVIQIIPKRRFYDYIAKYTPNQTEFLVPAPIPEAVTGEAQEVALAAHEVLGCRCFSRVDMIVVPDRGPVVLELNTIPGMTNSSLLPKAARAAGIEFPELCRRMLASSEKNKSVCSLDPERSSASA